VSETWTFAAGVREDLEVAETISSGMASMSMEKHPGMDDMDGKSKTHS
jgi:hypothetical protein